jgi:hypothetical protein
MVLRCMRAGHQHPCPETFAFTGGRTASRPGRRAAVTGPARHLLPLAGMGAIVVEQAPWLHMVTM